MRILRKRPTYMFGNLYLFMVMSENELATALEQQPVLKFGQGNPTPAEAYKAAPPQLQPHLRSKLILETRSLTAERRVFKSVLNKT